MGALIWRRRARPSIRREIAKMSKYSVGAFQDCDVAMAEMALYMPLDFPGLRYGRSPHRDLPRPIRRRKNSVARIS